jgi:hypothetical protein
MKTPKPDDCIAAISVRFFANGALQVSGNVGDKKQALAMLAAAADSVRSQPDGMGRPHGIITPSRDVVVPSPDPDFPIVPRGDMVRA